MDIEQRFAEHDWSTDDQWRNYFEGLYPTPSMKMIGFFKRKYYRTRIDSSLPVNPPQSAASDVHSPEATTTASPASATGGSPPMTSASGAYGFRQAGGFLRTRRLWDPIAAILLVATLVFYALSILPSGAKGRFRMITLALGILGGLASTISSYGLPTMQPTYWKQISAHDGIGNTMLFLSCFLVDIWGAFFSPIIGTLLMLSNAISRIPFLASNSTVKTGLRAIDQRNNNLRILKTRMELIVGFQLLILLCAFRTSVMGVLMYWNVQRILYTTNGWSRQTYSNLHRLISSTLVHPRVHPAVNTYYQKMAGFLNQVCLSQRGMF